MDGETFWGEWGFRGGFLYVEIRPWVLTVFFGLLEDLLEGSQRRYHECIHEFHVWGKFERSLNATFIAIIPKKTGVVDIKDFRPISLMGGVNKIISQVLADRLKTLLEKVISKAQNAFIRGR